MELSIEKAVRFGWEKTKKHFGFLVLFLLGTLVVSVGLQFILDDNAFAPLISFPINLIIGMGTISIALKLYDTDSATAHDFFAPLPLFLNFLLASILYTIIVGVGFILLIIPGIIFSIMFSFFSYLIIDKKLGPIEALKKSAAITKGFRMQLFLLGLTLGLINLVGVLLLGIGLLWTIPLTWLVHVYAYRQLMGAQAAPTTLIAEKIPPVSGTTSA